MAIIKVLIADDHAVVRRGLRQIITEEPDFEIAGEASTGQQVLELIEQIGCDLVVLDITLPDKNGLIVLQELKVKCPTLLVLILSMHREDQFAIRALQLGAAGYLSKECAPEELVKALKTLQSGGRYISAAVAEELLAVIGIVGNAASAPPHLSERELQVWELIVAGHTLSRIAEELLLNIKTISTYRARLLRKLKLKTNADLVRHAAHHGLSPPK